jgi:hypothetical protein
MDFYAGDGAGVVCAATARRIADRPKKQLTAASPVVRPANSAME